MQSAATMETTGAILPDDLVPDDTRLVYCNRIPIAELDLDNGFDEELTEDRRDWCRYVDLALAYYNGIHNTDYIPEGYPAVQRRYSGGGTVSVHCGFVAVPKSTAVGCESASKYFCSTLWRQQRYGCEQEVVTSCCILDVMSSDCKWCLLGNPSTRMKELSLCWTRGVRAVPEHSHDLADGVTLSDKAKYRLHFALIALKYYNKKQHADYKLVDVLPNCMSRMRTVIHCNYIAKQDASSEKLFFAELAKRKDKDEWFVVSCCAVSGKTGAGCHSCWSHGGKRVIHPMRGFRFGFHPQDRLDPPRLRSSSRRR